MQFFYILATLLPLASAAPSPAAVAELLEARAINGHCTGTATGLYKTDGICISTTTCNSYDGAYITGGCPNDAANIKCCIIGEGDSSATNPCGGISWCDWTSNTCGGTRRTGYCPGGTDYSCCYFP